LTSAISLTM